MWQAAVRPSHLPDGFRAPPERPERLGGGRPARRPSAPAAPGPPGAGAPLSLSHLALPGRVLGAVVPARLLGPARARRSARRTSSHAHGEGAVSDSRESDSGRASPAASTATTAWAEPLVVGEAHLVRLPASMPPCVVADGREQHHRGGSFWVPRGSWVTPLALFIGWAIGAVFPPKTEVGRSTRPPRR